MSSKKNEVEAPELVRGKPIRTVTTVQTASFAAWASRRMGVTQSEALEVSLGLLRSVLEGQCENETVPEMDTGEYDFDELPE